MYLHICTHMPAQKFVGRDYNNCMAKQALARKSQYKSCMMSVWAFRQKQSPGSNLGDFKLHFRSSWQHRSSGSFGGCQSWLHHCHCSTWGAPSWALPCSMALASPTRNVDSRYSSQCGMSLSEDHSFGQTGKFHLSAELFLLQSNVPDTCWPSSLSVASLLIPSHACSGFQSDIYCRLLPHLMKFVPPFSY